MDRNLNRHAPLAPFRIDPIFVERVWGYRDLRPWFDRVAGEQPLGEVWLTGDACLVATGPRAGQPLSRVFEEQPEAMLGPARDTGSPLLVKMLFAREKLSVQVHPDDAMARKYGQPRGKTECWYALAAEPGARVAAGLKPGVTLEQVRAGIHDGTLEESLIALPVAAGDMIFVDAGTVHAIWPGCVILETQQNSDITYRLFDYGRPRELHIEKSLEAIRLHTQAGKVPPQVIAGRTILLDSDYFRVERVAVAGTRTGASLAGDSDPGMTYLFAAAGSARIAPALQPAAFEPFELPPRGIVAVPASSPAFVVEERGGLELIRIAPNWP